MEKENGAYFMYIAGVDSYSGEVSDTNVIDSLLLCCMDFII